MITSVKWMSTIFSGFHYWLNVPCNFCHAFSEHIQLFQGINNVVNTMFPLKIRFPVWGQDCCQAELTAAHSEGCCCWTLHIDLTAVPVTETESWDKALHKHFRVFNLFQAKKLVGREWVSITYYIKLRVAFDV